MLRSGFGTEGSCGNAEHAEELRDVLQLQKALQNKQGIMEEQFQPFEERVAKMEALFAKLEQQVSQEQDRMIKLEESVRRALVDIMPKVEELLARHRSPQPSCEAALHDVAPAGVNAAPSDGCRSTANVTLPAGTKGNSQQSLKAVAGGTMPGANISTSIKRSERAPASNEEGQATFTPAQFTKGASPASRPPAPPPSGASAATPPASLHEAAERGDAAAAQRCLASGAQVDARDTNGNTALHVAASSGRTEVVDILIANGSAVNRCGYRVRTPLHCAAAEGHKAIVMRLVNTRAKVDSRDADGATAAALAAQGGHAEVVLRLLDQGTPVEAADKEGRTLLMYAAEGGNIQIVAHLLEQGASPFTEDNNEDFPLLLGSEKGYGNVVGEMLKVAATGDTDLLELCLLVAGSADVVWSFADEARDLVLGPAGGDALVEAARDGRLEVVQALLRVGAGAQAAREKALRAAAEKGHRGCVVALLDDGVDVNARDSDYKSALYYADYYRDTKCVNELLRRGAKNN